MISRQNRVGTNVLDPRLGSRRFPEKANTSLMIAIGIALLASAIGFYGSRKAVRPGSG